MRRRERKAGRTETDKGRMKGPSEEGAGEGVPAAYQKGKASALQTVCRGLFFFLSAAVKKCKFVVDKIEGG